MVISIVFTGLLLSPLYIIWGAVVIAEGINSFYYDFPHFAYQGYLSYRNVWNRIEGGIMAIPLQIIIGLVISLSLKLWNMLIAQENIKPATKPAKPRKAKVPIVKDRKI